MILLTATAASAQTLELLHTFRSTNENPETPLLLASDGNMYGTTLGGGAYGKGMVFRLMSDGAGGYTCEPLHSFDGAGGMSARGGLMEASDGKLYGTTWRGGGNDQGAAYTITTSGDFALLHSFSDAEGSFPFGELVQAGDGNLYGTVSAEGPSGGGGVFRMDTGGNVAWIHAFDQSTEGSSPRATLLLASDGLLYGSANGGPGTAGTVFRMDLQGNLTVLHAFDGSDGSGPGQLVEVGSTFFGTTGAGPGPQGFGTAFTMDSSGFHSIHDFLSVEGYGSAALTVGSDGYFYGTLRGGPNGAGTVFRLDVSGAVTLLHAFDYSDGDEPLARPIEGPGAALFGTTSAGGSGFFGTVYRLDAAGLMTLCALGSGDGLSPVDRLVEASDGFLYGVTYSGGLFGSIGTAFRLSSDGQFATIHSFRYAEARFPLAGLTFFDGDLYGTSYFGGQDDFGTAYKLDLFGNVTSLHLFSETGTDGGNPVGSLTEGPDGHLYGATSLFGDCINGTVYRLDTDGTVTPIYQSCDSPAGPLLAASDGLMYGVAGMLGGGAGRIFRTATSGETSPFFAFTTEGPAGASPNARLVEGPGGLYGASDYGLFNQGSVFRVTLGGHASALHFFGVSGPADLSGKSGLLLASDGNFYGTTPGNGIDTYGSIYRVNKYGDFATIHLFGGTDGIGEDAAGLMEASDGNLYGVTPQGGTGFGVAYRLVRGTQPISLSPSSGSALEGASVAISGRAFQAGASVDVGGAAAVNVIVSDPTQMSASMPTLFPGTLNDVIVTNPDASTGTLVNGWFADFLDVAQLDPFHPFVETMVRYHVTAGYGNGLYGRDDPVTRAQMAVLLLRASAGPAFTPIACGTNVVFADVPCDFFAADWINALYREGITSGCGVNPLTYCPDAPVTRAQMAVLLLTAEHGPGYKPPACAGIFQDVPCSPTPSFAVDWIEQLYVEGITGGCSTNPLIYCPDQAVTRGQMAVFLTQAFGLQL